MKFIQCRAQYEAPNCTFNLKTFDAHRYSWWRFIAGCPVRLLLTAALAFSVPLCGADSSPQPLCEALESRLTDAALDGADTDTVAEYCARYADPACTQAQTLKCELE